MRQRGVCTAHIVGRNGIRWPRRLYGTCIRDSIRWIRIFYLVNADAFSINLHITKLEKKLRRKKIREIKWDILFRINCTLKQMRV